MKVGYARVSTSDQDPGLQVDALKKAGCDKIFTETASGAQRDRPQLAEALKYMRDGDTLVVWKLDRLARSMKQLLATVDDLRERGVEFRSLTEAMDTSTPGGRLTFHIFGALAEFERELIRERTRAGLAQARKQGRIGGRPKKLTIKDLEAAKGMLVALSVGEVAKRLGVSKSTLYAHLPAAATEARAVG